MDVGPAKPGTANGERKMHATMMKSNRRSFLKMGGIGLVAIVGGGYVAARLTDGSAEPILENAVNLTAEAQQMLHRVFDAVLHSMLPEGMEEPLLVGAIGALDAGISGLPPQVQKELGGLLKMLTFAPTRLALSGRWGGWENATREEVSDWLIALQGSSGNLKRLIYITMHDLATSSFYAIPGTWALVGYDGPLLEGPGEEV